MTSNPTVQFDARRANAEKIWAELQKRRSEREVDSRRAKKRQSKRNPKAVPEARKKRSGTQQKRLSALVEVALDDKVVSADSATPTAQPPAEAAVASSEKEGTKENPIGESTEPKSEESGGFFSKMKDMYEKADQMAASQALLLNKELEELGVVDKITDETGLKIIGKDAASLLNQGSAGEGSAGDDEDDNSADTKGRKSKKNKKKKNRS